MITSVIRAGLPHRGRSLFRLTQASYRNITLSTSASVFYRETIRARAQLPIIIYQYCTFITCYLIE